MDRQQYLQQLLAFGVVAALMASCGGSTSGPGTAPTASAALTTSEAPMATATSVRPALASTLSGQRVLLVIYRRFEESEYGVPRAILEERGAAITVASSSLDVLKGHEGMEVRPDLALSQVRARDVDAIVFVGGYAYQRDDPEAQRVAQEAAAEGKLLAAICVAPITLATAGVIEGKRVTASTGHAELGAAGGILSNAAVERDGLIITANGPAAAQQFGEAIAAALAE